MDKFSKLYSKYYDLFYRDKDYKAEVEYINKLINRLHPKSKNMLDLGCGTARHLELFYDKGFQVCGVDISKEMLENAKKRVKTKDIKLIHSSIQDIDIGEKFDVVVSLFHVMSYQNSNRELIQAFKQIKSHLKKDGIFIFDFWYGPAVLSDKPEVRVKRLEDENISITRVAEPKMDAIKNIVDVKYNIFIEDREKKEIVKKEELHKMRYFFDTELELICDSVGFNILEKYKWRSFEEPNFNSWNVVWVLKKEF